MPAPATTAAPAAEGSARSVSDFEDLQALWRLTADLKRNVTTWRQQQHDMSMAMRELAQLVAAANRDSSGSGQLVVPPAVVVTHFGHDMQRRSSFGGLTAITEASSQFTSELSQVSFRSDK
eukprot:TRINITY_DN29766_c0_g1_i2.p2 TRINITY_DN29766_c0_g1~~TRINITY_DN29766_c0_g1_i2.p2  ORF type:complete len:121 (+),score=34.59 TRINITY_DN29766_c0_g1_i2:213-575(+)